MKLLLIADGSGSELQLYTNKNNIPTLKIYTDINGGIDNCQSIELDLKDLKSLIKELKRIHYDLK